MGGGCLAMVTLFSEGAGLLSGRPNRWPGWRRRWRRRRPHRRWTRRGCRRPPSYSCPRSRRPAQGSVLERDPEERKGWGLVNWLSSVISYCSKHFLRLPNALDRALLVFRSLELVVCVLSGGTQRREWRDAHFAMTERLFAGSSGGLEKRMEGLWRVTNDTTTRSTGSTTSVLAFH